MQFIVKLIITVCIIVVCVQIGKRMPSLAGLIAAAHRPHCPGVDLVGKFEQARYPGEIYEGRHMGDCPEHSFLLHGNDLPWQEHVAVRSTIEATVNF